jgi:hypothetical protein
MTNTTDDVVNRGEAWAQARRWTRPEPRPDRTRRAW